MITGIVVALPEELKTLTAKRVEKDRCVFIADKLLVAHAGVGAANAAAAAQLLVGKGATQLLSWGCAGGLDKSLRPGTLLLPAALVDVDDQELPVTPQWHQHALRALAAMASPDTGKLAEAVDIIASSEDKQQLRWITGAVAVDMESVAIAKVAIKHRLPFLVIRTVVDPAHMDLPKAIAYAHGGGQGIRPGRLALYLLLHPADVPRLLRLGGYFRAASATLRRVGRHLQAVAEFKPARPGA